MSLRDKFVFVLGAADPEMSAIDLLLTTRDCCIEYARSPNGSRVYPGNAYSSEIAVDPAGRRVVAVECGGDWVTDDAVIIDHHNPGDPGHGKGPEDYLLGSSLGQVMRFLAWELYHAEPRDHPDYAGFKVRHGVLTYEVVSMATGDTEVCVANGHLIAAADHCLLAAYKGECPEIAPYELQRFRSLQRARFQKRGFADVQEDTTKAMAAIRGKAAATGATPVDMTGEVIPELPEAACRLGIPVLAGPLDTPDGRRKVVLQAAPSEVIEAFLADETDGLVDKYGCPARGYAGGYKPIKVCTRCGAEEYRNSNMTAFDFESKEDGSVDIDRPIMGGMGICGDMHDFVYPTEAQTT